MSRKIQVLNWNFSKHKDENENNDNMFDTWGGKTKKKIFSSVSIHTEPFSITLIWFAFSKSEVANSRED